MNLSPLSYLVVSVPEPETQAVKHSVYTDPQRAEMDKEGRLLCKQNSCIIELDKEAMEKVVKSYFQLSQIPDLDRVEEILGQDWYEGTGIDAYWTAQNHINIWLEKQLKTKSYNDQQFERQLDGLGLIESVQMMLERIEELEQQIQSTKPPKV